MPKTITIEVAIDSSGAVTGGKVVNRQLNEIAASSKQATAETARQSNAVSEAFKVARRSLVSYYSAVLAFSGVKLLAGIADEYANIGAKLKLASGGTVAFADAQRQALRVAQETASELSTTAELIDKLSTSFRSLGGDAKTSFDVAVQLSETISKAVALSGAGAAAASAAITQLGQGLASGTLRGDELNSVLEQTPRLAQAIAKGMGVTIGQLRNLGQQGKITAKQIVEALSSQAAEIDREYAELPLTIGRAWTKLGNSVKSYIGIADQASGASRKIANVIDEVAGHIDDIVRAVVTLGEIVATVYAGKMIRWGVAWIANLRAQSTAVAVQGAAVEGWAVRSATAMRAASGAATAAYVAQSGWAVRTASSFKAAVANVGKLGIAFRILGSAIIGWEIGDYLQGQFQIVREAGAVLVTSLATAWEDLKYSFKLAWLIMKDTAIGAINEIREHMANVLAAMANVDRALPGALGDRAAAELDNWAAKIRPATSAAEDFKKTLGALNKEHAEAVTHINDMMDSMMAAATADQHAASATDGAKKSTADLVAETKKLLAQLGIGTQVTTAAAAATDKYAQAMQDARTAAADAVSAYTNKTLAPDVQALHDYEDAVRKVADAAGKQIARAEAQAAAGDKNVDVAKVEASAYQQVTDALDRMRPVYEKNLQLAREKMDVAGQMIQQMQQQTMLAGLNERDAAIARAGMELENQLRQSNLDLSQQQIDAEKQRVMAVAATTYDEQKAGEAQKQAAQDFVGYWRNALDSVSKAFGDLFTGGIKSFKDFGKSLKSIAQQMVSDIVAQFLRMRVLGPLFNSILGSIGGYFGYGGSSLAGTVLGIAGNYYGGGGTISPQGGYGGSAAGGGGVASYLQTGSALYKGYQYLGGGGVSLTGGSIVGNQLVTGQTAGYGIGGLNTGLPGGQVLYVNSAGQVVGSTTGYAPLGGSLNVGGGYAAGGYSVPYASIGGGILGAYYGYNHAGGGVGGVAAGVSYGALGAGLAGTAAGVAGGASIGAAATGAYGAIAGASWIPVVGWILAALAVVDLATGGKLFGTGERPFMAKSTLGVGPGGGTAQLSYVTQKQKALFGGHEWKEKAIAPTADVMAAADKLYDSVSKAMVQGAQKLGIDVPQMITASLQTQTNLDKHGKPEATKYVVEYMGRTWEEASADAAAQRIGAEAIVATVAASAGQVAQQIAEQWRSSADTLLDGAQMMLAAQSDIHKGNTLLALGADETLSSVTKLVQQMQADGETLAQTYARLAQANQQYLDFVAQFNDQIQGAGLAVSLAKINQTMQANIDQANALAQAAGLAGAREEDLANIHQTAAQQAADAMRQFTAAADQLATKLYATTGHTLAAVVQQIDALEGKIKSSVDLALGDLSPLTDQDKLDLALKGLRSGTTSADQVLSLGRQLYATGSDYTGLYNKVQEILGQPSAATAAGSDEINSTLDQLNGLVQQRDHLTDLANQAQRASDVQNLAGYVADLSTVSGQSYQQVADSLGFSLTDLAKDLGTQDVDAYLQHLSDQDIPGSLGKASNEIVSAIQGIGRDIVQALVGGPVTGKAASQSAGITIGGDDTATILQSIDTRLGNIEQHTGDTAGTNRDMATQGAVGNLRVNQGNSRNFRVAPV